MGTNEKKSKKNWFAIFALKLFKNSDSNGFQITFIDWLVCQLLPQFLLSTNRRSQFYLSTEWGGSWEKTVTFEQLKQSEQV
jgi:hypothetical protein